MSANREPETVTPWYRRTKALLISAGALAGALAAVIGLWKIVLPPPDADVAKIESVAIIKQTSLAKFASHDIGKELPLNPVPRAAVHKLGDTEPLALTLADDLTTVSPRSSARQTLPTISAPSIGTSTAGTPTSAPSPTQTPKPSASLPAGETSTPTASKTPTTLKVPKPIPMNDQVAIQKQKELSGFDKDALPKALYAFGPQTAVGENGEQLPPAEVAKKLARALEEVNANDGTKGKDPVGWTVAVRLNVEGLADVPLLLTWSLDGVDVSDTWQAENLAYRIVARTPHDTGTAEIWVPDLKKMAGLYSLNVRLSYESDGATADLEPMQLPKR